MTQTNPMGWPRGVAIARPSTPMDQATAETVLDQLSEIFVERTGMAKGISLETDSKTGQRVFQFHLARGSNLSEKIVEREIRGIPVRFVSAD